MNETIPGGAFKSADGSWHDANGQPLNDAAITEAERLSAEQHQQIVTQEAQQVQQLNPMAAVAAALLNLQPAPAQVAATEPAPTAKRSAKAPAPDAPSTDASRDE